MRISRIYLPETGIQEGQAVHIEGIKAHYIRNVLRLKTGHLLEFFTPDGRQYQGTIGEISKHRVSLLQVKPTEEQPQASSLKVTLVQGISSSDRMDYTIQKAAELGCQRIIPVLTEFCSQKLPAHKFDKKLAHWQGVAVSACEQCGRSDLLEITPISQLSDILGSLDQGIYLEPTATTTIHQLPTALQHKLHVLIGPEGGFSPGELESMEAHGLTGVVLGKRVLRTETVAPVILSALHTLYGDFIA
jgi:16S rRNA (uracil1498-N3)-methyltransferase